MSAIRFMIIAAAAAIASATAAIAQTDQILPGSMPGGPGEFRTTGTPSGFQLPNVQLQRRPVQQLQQPAPSPSLPPGPAASAPPQPENPYALQTGRVKTPPKDQSVSTAAQSLATAEAAPSKYLKGMVLSGKARVYDGHSLVVDGHAVRLDGVDAPGLLQHCKTGDGASWRCGEESYRRLNSLIDGRKVTCRVEEQVGEGAAAVCSVQGLRDLAEAMVRDGLAVPNGHDEGRYAGAVSSARSGRVGMWVGSFEAPWKWRESGRR